MSDKIPSAVAQWVALRPKHRYAYWHDPSIPNDPPRRAVVVRESLAEGLDAMETEWEFHRVPGTLEAMEAAMRARAIEHLRHGYLVAEATQLGLLIQMNSIQMALHRFGERAKP